MSTIIARRPPILALYRAQGRYFNLTGREKIVTTILTQTSLDLPDSADCTTLRSVATRLRTGKRLKLNNGRYAV